MLNNVSHIRIVHTLLFLFSIANFQLHSAALRTLLARKPDSSDEPVNQRATINPLFSDLQKLYDVRKNMDQIEEAEKAYPDYAERTGMVWSDVEIDTTPGNVKIVQEYPTRKLTFAAGEDKERTVESVRVYPKIENAFCTEILPSMFDVIRTWRQGSIPDRVFAALYLQRAHTSEAMTYHQDPGQEKYPEMGDYSLIGQLSDATDPEYGWSGGKLTIRPGRQDDPYDTAHEQEYTHLFNQALVFNNKANSHAVSAVTPISSKQAKRDLAIVVLNLRELMAPYGDPLCAATR